MTESATLADVQRDALVVGPYRYWLTRRWDSALPQALVTMLNPSKANRLIDDQTVRKLYGFCERWGYGGFAVGNLFGFMATDPDDLLAAERDGVNVIGPDNLAVLADLAGSADLTLVAWGASTPKRAALHITRVTKLLAAQSDLYCLGRTRSGAPRHPLMVGYAQQLELFSRRTA